MDTLELLYWCNKAKALHESTYKENIDSPTGKYLMTMDTALKATRPLVATDTDESLASAMLFSFPNDVDEWYCEAGGKTKLDIDQMYDLQEKDFYE